MKSLYGNHKQLNSEQNKLLAAKISKGDLRARKTMIEGNAGFAYKRAIKYASINRNMPKVEEDDILQAALLGLVEAVDRYDVTTGYSFTTYAHFWILKRITEEISLMHWSNMRPPRTEMRAFLYKRMDSDESSEYMRKYMSGSVSDISYRETAEDEYQWAALMVSVEKADLSEEEYRVFDSLYGVNDLEDDLSDLTRGQVGDIEFGLLEKLKEVM